MFEGYISLFRDYFTVYMFEGYKYFFEITVRVHV